MPNHPAPRPQHALTTPAEQARAEIYLQWLGNLKSANTVKAYRRAVETFWRDMGVGLWEARPSHFVAWRHKLAARYGAASVNLKLAALSSFYNYVCKHRPDLCSENPLDAVDRLTVNPYGKATRLKPGQARRVLDAIDTTTLDGLRDYALLRTLLTLGVRLAVVATATVDDLTNVGGEYSLHYTNKGGDDVTRTLPPGLTHVLLDYVRASGTKHWLFDMGAEEMETRRRYIQDMVVTRCDAALGPGHGITVHSLRHSAAMAANDNGASITEISGMLDHSSVRVTSIYLSHLDKESGNKAVHIVDDLYPNLRPGAEED